VTEEWIESKLLPTATRNAYFEDILLDSLLSKVGETQLKTIADAKIFTTTTLEKWVKIDIAATVSGAIDRLAMRVFIFNNTKRLEKDSKLGKLLKIADRSLTIKNPIVSQAYERTKSTLVLTFPEFDESDEATAKAVSHLIALACALHSTKPENVSILRDRTYGSGKVTISSTMNKLIDAFISSAHHPQGLYLGEVFNYPTGFKGNLVTLLAAMRLLNIKGEFVRKRKFAKDSGKSPVSFNSLQETFNTLSGLKTDNSMAYTVNCVKAILSSSVKAHNKGFPGGWINSSRSINLVKSDFALINLLGWTEKVPSHHKLVEVIFNTVDTPNEETGADKHKLVNITQDKRHFSHREFRTAVALTLPRIVFKNRKPEADVKLDPFSVRDLAICNNFCRDRRDLLVDRLNESYGFRVSLKNPKSKTREIHYKMSRDRLLAESANIPLINAEGEVFDTFSDLPKAIQKYLRDTFRYPVKRGRDEASHAGDEASMEVDAEGANTVSQPPQKKKRVTRGQSAAATRKSGRLATQKSKTIK
jgi:hypothetical protein